jgi:hypothetical protein
MDTGQTLLLHPRRAKLVGLLLVSAAFVATGVWMVRAGQWLGWLGIAFFGLGVAVSGLQLLPNSTYLRMGPDGFTVCTLFRSRSCRWSDVKAFEVRRVGRTEMVVFSFSRQPPGSTGLRRLNVRLAGAEAAVAASGSWMSAWTTWRTC